MLNNANYCLFEPCPSLGIDEWSDNNLDHARDYFMYKYEPKAKYMSYIHLDGKFYETYLKALTKYGSIQKENPLPITRQNQ